MDKKYGKLLKNSCIEPLDLYKCPKCAFKSNLRVYLHCHMIVGHSSVKKRSNNYDLTQFLKNLTCRNCQSTTFSKLVHLKHTTNCKKKQYCQMCPFTTTFPYQLEVHKSSTHPSVYDWLKCKYCNYRTKCQLYLDNHVKKRHSKAQTIKCTLCPFKTKWHNSLKKHVLANHLKEVKWLRCDSCSFQTQWKAVFARHVKSHNPKAAPEEWFSCKQCDYKGAKKYQLNKHIRMAHRHTGVLLKCQFCDYVAHLNRNLKRHLLRKHLRRDEIGSFECDVCGFKTRASVSLNRHLVEEHGSR